MSRVSIIVIGLGNSLAGDDGVGEFIIQALEDFGVSKNIELQLCPAPGPEMIDLLNGEAEVWFIDAAKSDTSSPGEVIHQRIEPEQDVPLEAAQHMVSTHGFSMAELIRLATTMNRRRATIELWGIVGERFDAGTGLSEKVQKTAVKLADQLRAELENRGTNASV